MKKWLRRIKTGMRSFFCIARLSNLSSYVYMSYTFLFSLWHEDDFTHQSWNPFLTTFSGSKVRRGKVGQNEIRTAKFIEEKRLTFLCYGQLYQRRRMQAYNKKLSQDNYKKESSFWKGSLTINKILGGNGCPTRTTFTW